ncbi:hypothetical protein RQP46_009385 [Phenoliferia psychrophenolica]
MSAAANEPQQMTINISKPLNNENVAPVDPSPRKEKTGVIPLSLPAILQNPKARLSHLAPAVAKSSKLSKEQALLASGVIGKRRRRRFENALLSSNPHILRPTTADLLPRPAAGIPTFSPRPVDFPASLLIPSSELLVGAPSINGQYSFSLKGIRRALRGGTRARDVVDVVEASLTAWLSEGGKRASDFHTRTDGSGNRIIDATPYLAPVENGETEEQPAVSAIIELSRLPHAMLWVIADPYDRFICHCIARYYGVISFSAPDTALGAGNRVTHLLRPNMVRPNAGGVGETPPGTDLSATEGETSAVDTEGSEMGSASESEWEELGAPGPYEGLDAGDVTDRSLESYNDDYDSDDADADDGTDDDAGSELESSLADLRLAAAAPGSGTPSMPMAMAIPNSASPARTPFFPSPSSTPRPLAAALAGTTPTPTRARRTRASFPPSASRIREEGNSESRSRSRSSSPVARPSAGLPRAQVPTGRRGWQWPEQTFAAFLFS